MNNAITYVVCSAEGETLMPGFDNEFSACQWAKGYANGTGEGCTVVSSVDETACLHDITPDYVD